MIPIFDYLSRSESVQVAFVLAFFAAVSFGTLLFFINRWRLPERGKLLTEAHDEARRAARQENKTMIERLDALAESIQEYEQERSELVESDRSRALVAASRRRTKAHE